MTRLLPKTSRPLGLHAGFSLMEMAIVLMIMGILMGGVLVSISQVTLNARRASALAQLREVEEALYGFAQSQRRLPCPASDTSLGYEAGSAGACTYSDGFLPAATLGLFGQLNDDGLLLDAWQNPLRYSVVNDDSGGGNPDFTLFSSIQTFFNASTALTATDMLCVAEGAECTGTVLSDLVPAAVYTMGPDWASFTSVFETENADDTTTFANYAVNGDQNLVSRGYVEEAVTNQFDDQLIWLSPYVLFNRMVSAGKLP